MEKRELKQLEAEVIYLRGVYDYFTGQKPSDKEFIQQINMVKNELKHNESGDNLWFDADFENEAYLHCSIKTLFAEVLPRETAFFKSSQPPDLSPDIIFDNPRLV